MTENIVDFTAKRNERDRPDPQFVKKDDFGREMYLFTLDYEFEGGHWGADLWAYSAEDANARVAAMRQSLVSMGQVFGIIPA